MGFGVTPSKVGAFVQQNGMVQQLQTIVQNVQQQMQEMRQQNQLEMQEMKSMFLQSMRQQNHLEQSNLRNVSRGDICANTKCKLLHWSADELVVAEGQIASTDPNTKVHHVILGGSCWKVWVDKVLVEKVDLIRPNDEMQFLNDAIGSTVAWLSKFIVLCD
ncbi:uncharacterized protein LOC122034078 [Zingiber officinale]|uniref:uncharacterized protein LOC122034078 n=1 Tax=Zingiber officinale TaxID=94328 RepID=UPI001C4D1987|nr:uncharacterized protein LOC122034078 [Zingiber officinale]